MDANEEAKLTVVKFKFSLDERVITPFGSIGVISTLGYDESGQHYYVKTEHKSDWLKESQLKPAD
jgi:hypothetical protein